MGEITRRSWLGAAGAVALAGPAVAETANAGFQVLSSGTGAHDYGPALAALAAYAGAEVSELGLPGMVCSLADADGFAAVIAIGFADIEMRAPMRPGQLMEIGSISKSFLALTILALADEGKIDLEAPLSRYLPEAPLPLESVSIRQLLSHTSGLPADAPAFPRVPDGRLWLGFAPGSRFSYSNTAYVLLGAAVERISGLSHREAILRAVRAPMGVADIAGEIADADRPRYPKSYLVADQGAAAELPKAAMDEAKWDPETTPAGCIAASAPMMARYLRGLLTIGAGRGAGVVSDTAARAFTGSLTPSVEDFGPGSHYALGVAIQPVDGAPCLHHTGGMVAFTSSFHADPAAGVAAFASVNARQGAYRPRQTTAYAIRLMRAARARLPLPAPPDPWAALRVKDPSALFGTFTAADGRAFTIAPGADFPGLSAAGDSGPLYQTGVDLASPHALFSRHLFDPVLAGKQVTGFWWGESLFSRDRPAAQPASPERLQAMAGLYINRDPWVGRVHVLVRGDQLVIEGAGPLAERGGFWSLAKDPGGIERFRFDGFLNGRASRLNASGVDLVRL